MPLVTCRTRRLQFRFLAFGGYDGITAESMHAALKTLVDTAVTFSTSRGNIGSVQHGSFICLSINAVVTVAIGAGSCGNESSLEKRATVNAVLVGFQLLFMAMTARFKLVVEVYRRAGILRRQ